MKNLFILATAVFALASCSNNETVENDGPVELRLSSGIEVQQARAFISTQSTSISSGEAVSVWVDDAAGASLYKANQLAADGSNGFTGGTPMYFPQNGKNIKIYAIHGNFTTPFGTDAGFPTEGAAYEVKADQSGTTPANYTHSDLLYAYESNVARSGNPTTATLTFYHMLSKLEIAIVQGDGGPELAASGAVTLGGVTLNGTFTPSTTATMATQAERADMLTAAATPASDNMTLGQATCRDFTSNVSYNEAILVPQDMSGKVLAFKLKSGGTLKYTIPGSTTFESGKKYQYHITLKLTGLTVDSTIEDWDAVAAKPGNAEMQ